MSLPRCVLRQAAPVCISHWASVPASLLRSPPQQLLSAQCHTPHLQLLITTTTHSSIRHSMGLA